MQSPETLPYSVEAGAGLGRQSSAGYRFRRVRAETLVTLHAGERPTAGYEIEILGVTRSGGLCTVEYRVDPPGPDAIVAQVISYPALRLRIRAACSKLIVKPELPLLRD
jgi:hypothetical protein